jgi:hypothetical protein
MANYYINPSTGLSTNSGTTPASPYKSIVDISSIATGDSIFWLRGTEDKLWALDDINYYSVNTNFTIEDIDNITLGAYTETDGSDSGIGAKPIYSRILNLPVTSQGYNWLEVKKTDFATEVDNPGDTNIWFTAATGNVAPTRCWVDGVGQRRTDTYVDGGGSGVKENDPLMDIDSTRTWWWGSASTLPFDAPAYTGGKGLYLYSVGEPNNVTLIQPGLHDILEFNRCNNVSVSDIEFHGGTVSYKNTTSTADISGVTFNNCNFYYQAQGNKGVVISTDGNTTGTVSSTTTTTILIDSVGLPFTAEHVGKYIWNVDLDERVKITNRFSDSTVQTEALSSNWTAGQTYSIEDAYTITNAVISDCDVDTKNIPYEDSWCGDAQSYIAGLGNYWAWGGSDGIVCVGSIGVPETSYSGLWVKNTTIRDFGHTNLAVDASIGSNYRMQRQPTQCVLEDIISTAENRAYSRIFTSSNSNNCVFRRIYGIGATHRVQISTENNVYESIIIEDIYTRDWTHPFIQGPKEGIFAFHNSNIRGMDNNIYNNILIKNCSGIGLQTAVQYSALSDAGVNTYKNIIIQDCGWDPLFTGTGGANSKYTAIRLHVNNTTYIMPTQIFENIIIYNTDLGVPVIGIARNNEDSPTQDNTIAEANATADFTLLQNIDPELDENNWPKQGLVGSFVSFGSKDIEGKPFNIPPTFGVHSYEGSRAPAATRTRR